jgi:Protein of unknown function (DUF3224)
MMRRTFVRGAVIAILGLGCSAVAYAQSGSIGETNTPKGAAMMSHASGSFDVNLSPLEPYNTEEGGKLARLSIDKQFHGDLEATSKGEMLSAGTDIKGSAGYVAIERVTGTLNGHSGSFVLQHSATMTRGEPYLNIVVVPDSGTSELKGLTGKMAIIIADGKHSYEFTYNLEN